MKQHQMKAFSLLSLLARLSMFRDGQEGKTTLHMSHIRLIQQPSVWLVY